MKVVGIQIKSTDVIVVVLEKKGENIIQSIQSTKFGIQDHQDSSQVRQFRDQINATLDSINPSKVCVLSRQHKGKMASSPLSFKLEGIIQLYEKALIEFISPQTVAAYKKKNMTETAAQVQQQDAFDIAFMTLNN